MSTDSGHRSIENNDGSSGGENDKGFKINGGGGGGEGGGGGGGSGGGGSESRMSFRRGAHGGNKARRSKSVGNELSGNNI